MQESSRGEIIDPLRRLLSSGMWRRVLTYLFSNDDTSSLYWERSSRRLI
jgi:hypothetical protein